MRSRLQPLMFLLGCLFVALGNFYCSTESKDPVYLNHSPEVTYVGKEQCRSCHADVYNTFIETGMGKSFGVATKQRSAAHFNQKPIYDASLDMYYQAFLKGDSIFIREYRLKGKDTSHYREQRVDYIIGSGQHTNSHLGVSNGYVFQLPLTWYAQKKQWDLPPGFEQGKNPRFSRAIELECMSCHNAYTETEEGAINKYVSIPNGIDCERCHGPGSLHIKEKLAGNLVDTAKEIDYTIVNPAKLSWERQIDVCQRCHLQGNAVLKPGKKFTDFRPGMKLSDYIQVFMPKYKGRDNEFIMASHAQRLQMSKCFLESNKSTANDGNNFNKLSLTCITCHNPHVSVKVTGNQVFNSACLKCHNSNACKEQPDKLAATSNNCVQCHMPSSGSIDIPHVTVHDHKIGIPVSMAEVKAAKEFEGIYCVNYSSPDETTKAGAYLNYYEKFEGEPHSLDSGQAFLAKLQLTPIQRDLNIHLLYLQNNWGVLTNLANSKEEYKAQNLNNDWSAYRIGQAFQNLGQVNNALAYYERAEQLAPKHPEWRNKLGVALIQLGNFQKAEALLETSLKLNPLQEEPWVNLGFAKLNLGKKLDAMNAYNNALKLNPDQAQALLNRAALYYMDGKVQEAKADLKQILTRQPNNEEVKNLLKKINTL